ncbi:MAG: hypothetical protein MUE39_05310 [Gammaproteobacteria bacterium]|nr:hypothetical protein [Gammaproteobacteria bacterium]
MSLPSPDRPFLPSWLRWHEWLDAAGRALNSPRWEPGYVLLLLGFVLVYQIASPIVVGDTDMWYHLNGGRYFWEHGSVPSSPFFSFNDPDRAWVNYYWGFQALVYKVHALAGYQGLVVLRAVLVFAILALAWGVIAGFRQKETTGVALLALFALYVILVDGRGYQLRPHLFSYAFILFFVYVLEHRPRWVFLLPPATIAWVNLHGVEWVVGALIGGAYLAEFLLDRRLGRDRGRGWGYAAGIVACLPALFVNPHGVAVLWSSFAHPADITQYVNEMLPLSWEALFTVATQSGQLGAQSAFALLFVFTIYAVVATTLGRRMRLAHLVLLGGGLLLLGRGARFIWEWALLALPLLSAQAATIHAHPHAGHGIPPSRATGLVVLLLPFATLVAKFDFSQPYPFNPEGLPRGIATFLKDARGEGNLFMNPSYAGYVQWELGPRVRVFADMELPPFGDWDMFRAFSAHRSAEAFKRLKAEYPIDFVSVELKHQALAGFLKESGEFAPVFFDDAGVLYAHRQRQQAIVDAHELSSVNPFNLRDDKVPFEQRAPEIEKVLALDPRGGRAVHGLTRGLVDAKRYAEAEKWADLFLERQPRDPNSYLLKGVILENTERCPEALAYFRRAFPLSARDFHPSLHQHLGSCLYVIQDFATAYEHFEKGVNIYTRNEPGETLYQYAFSAVVVGDARKARILLKALLYQTPESETRLIERARGLLAQLDSDPSLSAGLFEGITR